MSAKSSKVSSKKSATHSTNTQFITQNNSGYTPVDQTWQGRCAMSQLYLPGTEVVLLGQNLGYESLTHATDYNGPYFNYNQAYNENCSKYKFRKCFYF